MRPENAVNVPDLDCGRFAVCFRGPSRGCSAGCGGPGPDRYCAGVRATTAPAPPTRSRYPGHVLAMQQGWSRRTPSPARPSAVSAMTMRWSSRVSRSANHGWPGWIVHPSDLSANSIPARCRAVAIASMRSHSSVCPAGNPVLQGGEECGILRFVHRRCLPPPHPPPPPPTPPPPLAVTTCRDGMRTRRRAG